MSCRTKKGNHEIQQVRDKGFVAIWLGGLVTYIHWRGFCPPEEWICAHEAATVAPDNTNKI